MAFLRGLNARRDPEGDSAGAQIERLAHALDSGLITESIYNREVEKIWAAVS
jgi:hypothetical protein